MKIYKPVGPAGIRSFENTKPVFVADSLDDLRGPTAGSVTLPLRLDWTPSNTYDLSDEARTCTMYATVLREAKSEDDLARFLERDLLVRMWASLRLPVFIRESWERRFPQLRHREVLVAERARLVTRLAEIDAQLEVPGTVD